MSQDSFTGGRGKIAPYQSTHIRVPDTIKTQLQQIVEAYRKLLAKNSEVGLSSFELHLDKFVDGVNPLYGVTTDDFKLIDAKQFEELKALYDNAISTNKSLREAHASEVRRRKFVLGILTNALKLKANAGGAIKQEIKKAIAEIDVDF